MEHGTKHRMEAVSARAGGGGSVRSLFGRPFSARDKAAALEAGQAAKELYCRTGQEGEPISVDAPGLTLNWNEGRMSDPLPCSAWKCRRRPNSIWRGVFPC